MKKRLIIYDIADMDEKEFLKANQDDFLFSAAPTVKHCIGCFGCWVKTPGKCVIKDRCDVIPSYMAQSDEVIIISPIMYGGYSQNIKAVMDRSIGYLLPYFRIVNGEMHHQMRHKKSILFRVHFYGKCDKNERDIAERLVKANAINFGVSSHSVDFHESIDSIIGGFK